MGISERMANREITRARGFVGDNRAMAYELWDTETRNIINTFGSEAVALRAARDLVALNSPAYPGALALTFEDNDGETTRVASGPGLGEWASAYT